MKKIVLFLILLLLPALSALAEDFTLETEASISGMNYRSWTQGYEPSVSDGTLTICLPVSSERASGKIRAALIMADESTTPLRPQETSASFQAQSGIYPVKLTLKLHSARVNGDYAAIVRIEGSDSNGNALSADFPIVIRIRDGRDPTEAMRPEFSSVTADLKPGETSAITAVLTNPSSYAAMTGVQLVISDASGEILPAGSDRLGLPDLLPGGQCEIIYPVSVLPSAKVDLHSLKFNLTYSTLEKEAAWEETFTLPVSQEIRLEHGGVELASTAVQGNMTTLTLPLMNLGRGELRNIVAKLTLPGIVDGQAVLVGSLGAGESRQAKITFTPGKDALGEVSGEITVSCEDAWANSTVFSIPVSIVVEEPVVIDAAVALDEAAEKLDWLPWALGAACGLMVLLLILQGTLLRRKIHRLEEERL